MIALTLALLIAQAEEAPAPAPPAASEEATPAPETGEETVPETRKSSAPQPKGADEAAKSLSKWASLPDHERGHIEADAVAKWREVGFNAVYPPDDIAFGEWAKWSEPEQIKLIARRFLQAIIASEPTQAMHYMGMPFYLEDKRWSAPLELQTELNHRLKKRRVDLWVLYDIASMSPADMEKNYGKPPSRLASWPWKNSKTAIAVANLSGHAAILLMRQVGATWQVVGFSD
jgi:hypothetical protein